MAGREDVKRPMSRGFERAPSDQRRRFSMRSGSAEGFFLTYSSFLVRDSSLPTWSSCRMHEGCGSIRPFNLSARSAPAPAPDPRLLLLQPGSEAGQEGPGAPGVVASDGGRIPPLPPFAGGAISGASPGGPPNQSKRSGILSSSVVVSFPFRTRSRC